MNTSTLLKLEIMDNTVALRTYSRKYGRNGRFLIIKDQFYDWLTNPGGREFLDLDIYSFMKAVHANEQEIVMTISWLSASGSNLHGHQEWLRIDKNRLLAFMQADNGTLTLLIKERKAPPTFDFSRAARSLSHSLADQHRRRALIKALRDMNWWNTHFTMYNDGAAGFGFDTDDVCPVRGGLILHHDNVQTKNGQYQRAYYGTHT